MIEKQKTWPPKDLLLKWKREFGLEQLIETGTFKGETTSWAANHFESVTTVEFSNELYKQTSQKYSHLTNIDFQYGDSAEVLEEIAPQLDESVVFCLDAHWCAGVDETAGEDDQCPLEDELYAIAESDYPHFIAIDDAKVFLSPPSHPRDRSQWPAITDIVDILNTNGHEYYLAAIEGVLVAVPADAEGITADYLQERKTKLRHETFGPTEHFGRAATNLKRGVMQVGRHPKMEKALQKTGLFPYAKKLYKQWY